jgi:hypothetical protein
MRPIVHYSIEDDFEKLANYEMWYMGDCSALTKADHPPTKFLIDLKKATKADEVRWVGGTTNHTGSNSYRETRYYTTFRDHQVCFAWDGYLRADCMFCPPVEIRLDDCALYGWGSKNDGPDFEDIEESIERRSEKKREATYSKRLEGIRDLS